MDFDLSDEQRAFQDTARQFARDEWLPHAAGPDDLVVIYVSSHGSPALADVAGVNYLVAYNTDKDSLSVGFGFIAVGASF